MFKSDQTYPVQMLKNNWSVDLGDSIKMSNQEEKMDDFHDAVKKQLLAQVEKIKKIEKGFYLGIIIVVLLFVTACVLKAIGKNTTKETRPRTFSELSSDLEEGTLTKFNIVAYQSGFTVENYTRYGSGPNAPTHKTGETEFGFALTDKNELIVLKVQGSENPSSAIIDTLQNEGTKEIRGSVETFFKGQYTNIPVDYSSYFASRDKQAVLDMIEDPLAPSKEMNSVVDLVDEYATQCGMVNVGYWDDMEEVEIPNALTASVGTMSFIQIACVVTVVILLNLMKKNRDKLRSAFYNYNNYKI